MLDVTATFRVGGEMYYSLKTARLPVSGLLNVPAMTKVCPRATSVQVLVDRLVGLVVKASASRAEDPGFKFRLRRYFSRSSHTSDLKIGTPVATLPDARRYGSVLGLVGPMSEYCD